MMVVPAETVEGTINELLQFCSEGDIIIDHAILILRTPGKVQVRLLNWASNILTVVLVVVFMVWKGGYCLMVGRFRYQYPSALLSSGALAPGIGAEPRTDPFSSVTSAEYGWLHCGPAGAGHFVKMVHNGVEYGIM